MKFKRRPALNNCECSRPKLKRAKACDRCLKIEAEHFGRGRKKAGKKEPYYTNYYTVNRACTKYLRDRGMEADPLDLEPLIEP